MCKWTLILLVSLTCHRLFAEPELKGTATELAPFLNGVPKTTSIKGEAEVRVPARRAVLTLRIATENRSLQEALRSNGEVRGKVQVYLHKQGISADRIQASKFSSTPKFGIFGEKAKSYHVENMLRVAVQNEAEIQGAAGAVDQFAEVQFGGVEFEYADKEASKREAISQACRAANEQSKIYEQQFGLKLEAIRFEAGDVGQMETGPYAYSNESISLQAGMKSVPAYSSGQGSLQGTSSSFGELVFRARVSVEYKVQSK